ncbi:APC family permease [Aurantibacillus circumpalustris]|uniref:APC family permease n=1 Tax=Aurantibacillus circumpalustris TaxID=3036359 RepID=UPI00295B6218|nr:amino acid permease [Aurantibacillus circumpalustris]
MSLFRKKTIESILQKSEDDANTHGSLAKHLGVKDLTAFGIAAIIGAGIFSTIGKASFDGGPGVIFLFIFTALACSFAAFAYAEFASLIPVSGSAYTYSYVAFGELFAWIIGWALIMEYSIGNVTVAISWSDYFTSLLNNAFHFRMHEWLCLDYFTAKQNYFEVLGILNNGTPLAAIAANGETAGLVEGYKAFASAPKIFGTPIIFDFPALLINVLITLLVYRGIKESRNASNIMVLVKIAVVLVVIFVGAFYVDTENWDPFMPNGVGGLLKGISAVFFAYIGFDAISTTAEECRNPQRDLPRGILYSIIICTILYVAIALVITGMVNYTELNVGDPLAYVFEKVKDLHWLSGVIAISAVVAMASVMLVFQLGQPRIWMSMSRDGLLPKAFAKIHPKYKTPSFSTIITGLLVAVPIFFVDINMVTDICSAGTLFAFCLVCGGVLKLRMDPNAPPSKFKTPYINSKYIVPVLFTISLVYLFFDESSTLQYYLHSETLEEFYSKIPIYFFFIGFAIFSVMAFLYNFSLIPSLGLLSCFYMLSQLGHKNWLYFGTWLIIGLIIYFVYGRRHSKLAPSNQ